MKRFIDLRSDTVTTPTERMRRSMYSAIVGDDVLGEDPTTQELEAKAADLFRKEAGLFLASGTMANQVAILTLCNSGDQVIVHRQSHINNLECAGLATICGVQPRVIDVSGGCWDLSILEKEIYQSGIQTAPTTLLCLEQTHDLNRGIAIPRSHIQEICRFAKNNGLKVFIDGARIFNASIALHETVATLAEDADLTAFCLSKGLACPVGSILVGGSQEVAIARRMRQRLGGGWRQAGILAAAGLVALDEMVERLAEDHQKALLLAEGLLKLGFGINVKQTQTNIIHIDLGIYETNAQTFCKKLAEQSILAKPIGNKEVRMITHKDIKFEDINNVLEEISKLCMSKKIL